MNAKSILRIAIAGAGVSLLAACGTPAQGPAAPPAATAQQATVVSAHGPNAQVSVSIDTPDMLQTETGPAFLPSNLVLPADTDVTFTVYNFDDATPLADAATKYATATGIVGSLQVEPMNVSDPNGAAAGPAKSGMSIDPQTVSHTFTVPDLGLNVPIAAQSRVTFTIHTGKAGTYKWHCMDPCGAGDTGWGGAMAMAGYMAGTLKLV